MSLYEDMKERSKEIAKAKGKFIKKHPWLTLGNIGMSIGLPFGAGYLLLRDPLKTNEFFAKLPGDKVVSKFFKVASEEDLALLLKIATEDDHSFKKRVGEFLGRHPTGVLAVPGILGPVAFVLGLRHGFGKYLKEHPEFKGRL